MFGAAVNDRAFEMFTQIGQMSESVDEVLDTARMVVLNLRMKRNHPQFSHTNESNLTKSLELLEEKVNAMERIFAHASKEREKRAKEEAERKKQQKRTRRTATKKVAKA